MTQTLSPTLDSTEYAPYVDDDALARGMVECPDAATDEELRPLVTRLCQFFQDLKLAQSEQPAIFHPGGEWADYLAEQQCHYASLVAGDVSAATEVFRHFWRNELGPVVKQYATFQKLKTDEATRRRFVDLMAYDYMVWRHLIDDPTESLRVPAVGNPWGYQVDGVTVAPKAVRYSALAGQIRNLTADVDRPVIAEIGAGYGGTAHYLLRGDAPMCYIDFDLPEVLTIAAYYLSRTLPHRRVLMWEPGMQLTAQTVADHDVILMPNWMLADAPSATVDVFLNTFSLSEMPIEVLREYFSHITRSTRGYFLHNNMDREGVENRGHNRVPCSQYPIDPASFKRLYKRYDLFQQLHSGRDGDYREELWQRIGS